MSLILNDFKPIAELRNEWDIVTPLLEGLPNLQNLEVSRNDFQMFAPVTDEDGPEFYDKLSTLEKRQYPTTEDDEFNENFWNSLESHINYLESHSITKRGVKASKKEEYWLEGLNSFFRDLFKKKDNQKISTQNLLSNIQFPSSQLSLKTMKKIFNFYKNLHLEVRAKKSQGFPVSFTDYWGRALSRRIFPKNSRSTNVTLSNVINLSSFQNFEMPFPIIVSDLREPSIQATSINSSIFEFTPFEFGSWDLKLFVNLKYIGSLFFNGEPSFHLSGHSICFTNFDNAGFITGTSSSLFNNIFIYIWKLAASSSKSNYRAIKTVLGTFGLTSLQDSKNPRKHPDYALYTPNPFFRYGDEKSKIFNSKSLYLVDGGEDGQNIPFVPLLQKDRGIDIIFALDSTVDSKGWPNGTILQNTAKRFNNSIHDGVWVTNKNEIQYINKFPEIPDSKEFISKKLNQRPIFFGCHLEKFGERNITIVKNPAISSKSLINGFLPPIIGYFPNSEYSYQSNTSTFQLSYDYNEVSKMLENGYNIATYANSTIDKIYSKCVGCILIKREFDRKARNISLANDMTIPQFCQKCFESYCYN